MSVELSKEKHYFQIMRQISAVFSSLRHNTVGLFGILWTVFWFTRSLVHFIRPFFCHFHIKTLANVNVNDEPIAPPVPSTEGRVIQKKLNRFVCQFVCAGSKVKGQKNIFLKIDFFIVLKVLDG